MEYMYVIGDAEHSKVGITKRPSKRLSDLRKGDLNRWELKELFILPFAHRTDSLSLESKVHEQLRPHHVTGEWFKISSYKAARVIAEVCGSDAFHLDVPWEPAWDNYEHPCDCGSSDCWYPVRNSCDISENCMDGCLKHNKFECDECTDEDIEVEEELKQLWSLLET